jgi:hypothetical protein
VRRVFGRIADQVGQHLEQPFRVGMDIQRRRRMADQFLPLRLADRVEQLVGVFDDLLRGLAAGTDLEAASLDPGQVEQPVQQRRHALSGPLHHLRAGP